MPSSSKSERTKERIQQAAAELFAARSFDNVTTRAIAREAGVDAALIHHYFGSKEGLFNAVLSTAISAEQLEAELAMESSDTWGRSLVLVAERIWTSPAGPALAATVRRAIAGKSSVMRDFVTRTILDRIVAHLECPEPERRLRAALVGSQMAGMNMARHIIKVDPLASLSSQEVADLIGPVLQHYLTGQLRSGPEAGSGDSPSPEEKTP